MVASPAFSEPQHRLNCFQNKSEKLSKSYCFGSEILPNGYTSGDWNSPVGIYKDVTRVRHVLLHFSRFNTFLFLEIPKLKYAVGTLRIRRHAPGCLRTDPGFIHQGRGCSTLVLFCRLITLADSLGADLARQAHTD